jgi:hypothetical protein
MWAVSADGIILSHRGHDNHDGASLDYWHQVASTFLAEVRHILVHSTETRTSADGTAAVVLHGARGARTGYSLALLVTDRRIYVTEFYGDSEAMAGKGQLLAQWLSGFRAH